MQLALLVQAHDMLQSAAITAIGPVHQIIELKSNSEIELDSIIQSGVLETYQTSQSSVQRVIYTNDHQFVNQIQELLTDNKEG